MEEEEIGVGVAGLVSPTQVAGAVIPFQSEEVTAPNLEDAVIPIQLEEDIGDEVDLPDLGEIDSF